jgi:hypothetical protein
MVTDVKISPTKKKISAEVTQSTFPIQTVEFKVNGTVVGTMNGTGSDTYVLDLTTALKNGDEVTVTVTDTGLLTGYKKTTL